MKILSLSAYCYPEQFSSSYLWRNLGDAYIKAGIKQVVCCPTPCRGVSDEVREKYKKIKDEYLYDGMVNVVRFPMFKEGKNPILRAIRYILSSIYMFFWAVFSKKTRDCDLIFVGSTPPTQGALAALVKKVKKIPFVYNLQDIFPDSLSGTGLAKRNGILWKLGRVIENFTYRNADKIIVISEDFKKNIMAKGVPEEKIEVIYNWVDTDNTKPISKKDNPLFEEFELSRSKFTIVYAGNLGNAQNIHIILEGAKELPEMQFAIFGTGGLEDEIRGRIEKEKLDNVHLNPLQPVDRVSWVYSLGDACVVSCKVGLGGSAMPSKTWNIMACGRPVVASFDEGELKRIIEKNKCGVFSQAGDVHAFVEAIRSLATKPTLCEEMGNNALQFIMNNLTKEIGTKKYIETIKSVVNK